jgi:hypothetical protein
MLNLYKNYIQEREGADLVENGAGFATYKPQGDNIVYVMDVYVVPEVRGLRVASNLLDEIAIKTECRWLITSCDENANNWEESEKAILGYGFKR